MMNKGSLFKGSTAVLSLALLTGCIGKKEEATKESAASSQEVAQSTGAVLCSINGKPVIRESDFLTNIDQMLKANPYFRGAGADSLPLSIKRKFFDELVKQEVILLDADQKHIANDQEFVKAYNEMLQLVKRSLTIQFFEKRIYDNIKVADNEIESHYNENKPRYIKEQGGVLVSGARFKSEDQANKFLDKVRKNVEVAEFEKLAKDDSNATFRSFGRIGKNNDQRGMSVESNIPAPIKEAAASLQSLPQADKVKVGNDVWVIAAFDKKDAVYFELSEIKPQIEGLIKNNEFKKVLDQEIKGLRERMTVNVNEDYFKEKEVAPAPAAQAATMTAENTKDQEKVATAA